MVTAYLGLGSNLGDRERNLRNALDHLSEAGGIEILQISNFRETVPVGGPSQPPYLNAAAKIRTELPAEELLTAMQEAERVAGRQKTGVRWGPREADLDLILYGDEIIDTERLVVPHPRFRDRAFVLEPLVDLAPDLEDPVSGRTIHELLLELMRRRSGKRNARLIETVLELREYVAMTVRNRFTVGLIPTMGCLHEGHLSLMRSARETCDKVVVSLFVNPTQFGPGEDFERYPMQQERDLRMSTEVGVDVVFAPPAGTMYTGDHRTWVTVEGLDALYCGASRPAHFRGVTTIVAKLFNLIRPHTAFFGQKDYQQSVLIRKMVEDLDFDVRIAVLPTVREEDGLALSSRNLYLDIGEREQAPVLHRALTLAAEQFESGERSSATLIAAMSGILEKAPELEMEYLVTVHPDTLEPVETIPDEGAAVLLAGRLGKTRLIDNILLGVTKCED